MRKTVRILKTLGKLVVGVIAAVVLSASALAAARWGVDLYARRQVSGTLTFEPAVLPGTDYQVGPFIVTWDDGDGGRLQVVHGDAPEKVLWATLPGRSFIAAARGVETVTESRGHFTVKDSLREVLAHQTVDSITLSSGEAGAGPRDGLVIRGRLDAGPGRAERPPHTTYTLTFTAVDENQLAFELEIHNGAMNRTFLTYASDPDEHFFGFGEQFTHLDMKGRWLPIFVTEQGIGRGAQPITLGADLTAGAGGAWHTTYAAVPHYITSRLRSLFLENSEHVVFDLRRPDRVQVRLFANTMAGRILYGETPPDLIREYTEYAGRMRPLPDWVLEGAVVGMQGGTAKVRRVLADLEARGTPVAAFWLQDWVGQRVTSFGKQLWWNWELDEDHYPGWDGLVADLDSRGIRVMTYVSPFLADVSEKPGVERNLFQEALALGLFVENADGEPYLIRNTDFSAGLLDLTDPAAWEWMKGIIREEVVGAGASGWMADFGEALPYDAVLHSGEPAARVHNLYPELWARLNREVVEEVEAAEGPEGQDEYVFFMRSGFSRSPQYATLFWTGDQLVSWDRFDGIKSAVTALLSSGLSGFAFNHSDIGGYTAVTNPIRNYHRSKELLMRWMELSAFTVVYRTHEGNRPEDNVQFYTDEETMAQFDRMARVYRAWASYRKRLVAEAAETGLPVVRHLFVHYPDDPNVYGISYEEFLVGSELLVAPVLDPGRGEVEVYLPRGRWVHLWTGEVYGSTDGDGGLTVTVSAPIGQPAVFFAEGSAAGLELVRNLEAEGLLGE